MKHLGKKIYAVLLGAGSAALALFLLASPTAANAWTLDQSNPTASQINCTYTAGSTSWDNLRNGTGCITAFTVGSVAGANRLRHTASDNSMVRVLPTFTLAATTTEIVAATLRSNTTVSASDPAVILREGTPTNPSSIATSDWDNFGTTDFGSNPAACNGCQTVITLNASGLAYLNAHRDGTPFSLSLLQYNDAINSDVGATAKTYTSTSGKWWLDITEITPTPECTLHEANPAATASGDQTIYARGSCDDFFPTSAWLGAVRIDPIGAHVAWSEGIGPFPDPYELETSDVPSQILSDGLWRVRMYARDGDTLYVSGYMDVQLDSSPYVPLTSFGTPEDWELDPDDAALTPDTTGDGYTFSASAVAIAAQGGLVIGADGCASIGEDATSTNCVFADNTGLLFSAFPLLSWPMGIFQAMLDAEQAVSSATAAYVVELPAHGDWIPAVVVIDSASRTKGIGAYISLSQQEFFRSIITFGIWVAFVLRMKGYADELIGRIPAPADPDAQRYRDMHG